MGIAMVMPVKSAVFGSMIGRIIRKILKIIKKVLP
jgi:hypothetical protein